MILVAGERRLKAILYLWQFGEKLRCGTNVFEEGQIPCIYQGDLDPLSAFEMELEENLQRDDLTWQERAQATSQLASLRHQQAAREGVPPPTIAEITEEVRGTRGGSHQDDTRKELIVARFLEDKDISEAKNVDDAFKILKRKEAEQKNIQLAAEIGKTFSKDIHRLVNDDCKDWLAKCPPDTFDIILTDPPYGMNADEFGDSNGIGGIQGAHNYNDSYESWKKLMMNVCPELFRCAKPQAHAYLFCDLDNFHELRGMMQLAGWKVFRTPIIWHKPNAVRAPWPTTGPWRRYELILYAVKGEKAVVRLFSDVVSYPSDSNLGHHAQKPIAIYQDLLHRSCRPGDAVLDPFCGSGTIFPACHELKLRATGVEMSPGAYGLAAKRLGELK